MGRYAVNNEAIEGHGGVCAVKIDEEEWPSFRGVFNRRFISLISPDQSDQKWYYYHWAGLEIGWEQ